MTLDALIAIDNYLFEFMSNDEAFSGIAGLLDYLGQCAPSPYRTKIPLSPYSPHNSMRSPQLRTRPYTNESSSAFSSYTFSTHKLPCIYNSTFYTKVGTFARTTVFRRVPADVLYLETQILAFFEMYYPGGVISLQQSILNPFYANEVLIASKYPDYYNHVPKQSVTYLMLLMESLFNIPTLLSRPFLAILTGEKLKTVTLQDARLPQYSNVAEISMLAVKYLYEKIRLLVPEHRLFSIFSDSDKLTFVQMHALCLEVVAMHSYFEFVNQFVYYNAFAYTAATRLFYDLDVSGTWTLPTAQFSRSGVSIAQVFFDIQEKSDIAGECGVFGYEQFYVLYCIYAKYAGNDISNFLSEPQLRSYNYFYYSIKAVQRIISGAGRTLLGGRFCYADFIIFALSDIVLDSPIAARYWFGVADVDGDELLSYADLSYFIYDQTSLWDRAGLEVAYYDVLRYIGDSVKFSFAFPEHFTLQDIIQARMQGNFFSALFSLYKFQQFESRDIYISNKSIYAGLGALYLHGDSAVWRDFWEQAYNELVEDE